MQYNNFSENEQEIIDNYSRFNKDIEKYFTNDQVIFMNDGYAPLDSYDYPVPIKINLSNKYLPWRYQASLYKKLLDSADIYPNNTGTLLDIGCGLGGGVSFYKDYYNFKNIIGVDLNPLHIDICQRRNKRVSFINASALNIPLNNESVDYITSVESVGYYDDINLFLQEAWRLLSPQGRLVIANRDLRDMLPYYNNDIFKLISWEDITKNVRVSTAISKYAIGNIDPNGSVARHIGLDEEFYDYKETIYYIVVLQKQ
jgi:ubiquinone/menaquinone biosynthesis C-methylase UbiE